MSTPSLPLGLLAELTHRCPMKCLYCSNPIQLERRSAELDSETWKRVFSQADELGILQVHLSGGEPTARTDLAEIIAHCGQLGLYTNLITSGVMLDSTKLLILAEAGLDHVQLSFQDIDAANADRIGGKAGSHESKLEIGALVVRVGLPLTVNFVVHRQNISSIEQMVMLALDMGARRIEIAHAQYYGWGLRNRSALMPTRNQALEATKTVERLRSDHAGRIVIDAVAPDYYARYPKPCMGGWASQAINITPSGKALPCHAAETIPGLCFDNVREKSLKQIWFHSHAFECYRGLEWMQEPCTSCDRKNFCRGGCRCQALAITGAANNADPACSLSPFNEQLRNLAVVDSAAAIDTFDYRQFEPDRRAS